MPQIPLYQPQANPAAPHAFAVTNTGAAAQAGQIDQADALIMRRGAQLADEFDTVQATQAYNQWRETERNVLSNPQDGLITREGTSAYGVQDAYKEWFDKSTNDARTGLANSRQAAYFDKLSSTHRETSLNTLAAHEIQQHRLIKKDSEDGLITNGILDVRANALDQTVNEFGERPSDFYIRQMKEGVVALNGGFSNAKQLNAIEMQGRVAQIEQMIDGGAFQMADAEMQKHKAVLGEHYFTLQKRAQASKRETVLGNAYQAITSQFGQNYEGALSFVNNPNNWSKVGIEYDEAQKLNERFSGLLSERERFRDVQEKNLERGWKQADSQALADSLAGKPVDLEGAARNRTMSPEMIKYLRDRREGARVDNFSAKAKVEDMIMRNMPVDQIDAEIAKLVSGPNPLLKDETAATLSSGARSEAYKRASSLIDGAAKPGEFDKFDADKNLRYVRFRNEFSSRLQAGQDYDAAANATIQSFTAEVRSTWKNLPAPEMLKGDRNDPAAVRAAKDATRQASLMKGPVWFKSEMKKIGDLEDALADIQKASQAQTDLDALLKKKLGK